MLVLEMSGNDKAVARLGNFAQNVNEGVANPVELRSAWADDKAVCPPYPAIILFGLTIVRAVGP